MGSRKVLVTGGAGFIGSHLVDRLVELGHTVRILDNLDPQVHPGGKKPDYLNPGAEFVAGDVRDRETVRRALQGVEVVFHEAAAVGVGQSQYRIQHYVDVNTRGTATLLDVLANEPNSVEKIVVAASMSSYGEGKARCPECGIVKPTLRPESQMAAGQWEVRCPYCQTPTEPVPTDERTPRQVNSVYSLTKKDQEDLVLLFGRTYGVQAVALRYFNVFGPRQSLSNPYTGVAAIFISRLKNGNRPVVYEDGQQTRDFVSVHDVVQANILAMEVDLPEPGGAEHRLRQAADHSGHCPHAGGPSEPGHRAGGDGTLPQGRRASLLRGHFPGTGEAGLRAPDFVRRRDARVDRLGSGRPRGRQIRAGRT